MAAIPSTSGMTLRTRPLKGILKGKECSMNHFMEDRRVTPPLQQLYSGEMSRGNAPNRNKDRRYMDMPDKRPSLARKRTLATKNRPLADNVSSTRSTGYSSSVQFAALGGPMILEESEEEAPNSASLNSSLSPIENGKRTKKMHILRDSGNETISGLAASEGMQTRSNNPRNLHIRAPQASLHVQPETPHTFFCPTLKRTRILLFVLAFLLLPAVQHFLWPVHWALTDRRLRALNSCLITAAFALNMFLIKKLISTFDFSKTTNGNMEEFDGRLPNEEWGSSWSTDDSGLEE